MAIEHYDDKFFKVRKGYIGKEEQLKVKWESIKNKAGIKEPYKNLMVWERHV